MAALFLGVSACGGGMAAEAKVYGPGPGGIDEAMADLDASEAEIASRFAGPPPAGYPQSGGYAQPGYPAQPTAQAQPYAQPPPPPPPEAPPKPADAPAAPATPTPAEPAASPMSDERDEHEDRDRCEIACKALGSMKRAAEHVCRAAGSGDERCSRARERVASATARVTASCEDCEG